MKLSKILIVGSIVLAGFNCSKQPSTDEINIGYQEIALYRHLFTAEAKGYFAEEGLKVKLTSFVSANQMIQAMIAGQLDATGLSNMQVALQIESKDSGLLKFINFLVWRENSFPDYILARKGVEINELSDFVGKTIGLHPGSAIRGFSKNVFEMNGIDPESISFIELKPSIMSAAILTGRVDGLYCMDPVATMLVESGQATIVLGNPMQYIFDAPVPIAGTAISYKLIKEHPETVDKIKRALDKAIVYLREPGHENEIAAYISQFTPITKELALKMNISEYWLYDEIDQSQIQRLSDKFFTLNLIDKAIKIENLLLK